MSGGEGGTPVSALLASEAKAAGASVRNISVLTHGRAEETAPALARLVDRAHAAGVTLRFDDEEASKHGLAAGPGIEVQTLLGERADGGAEIEEELCIVLGGDGTILRALRRYARTPVPVFAVNFGEIGFLATVEPEDLEDGIRRALTGDFELLRLPAIVLETPSGEETAINDVAIHRRVGERVAELAYELDGEEVGSVRCDGLVIATPAGSTGYNLANGGPVMAWGVEGFAVSFIAPHSITARALVAAPTDTIMIHNRSREALDVAVDGRPVCELAAGGAISARFLDAVGTIAQLPGSSFYHRLREKFGRLAR